MKWPASWLDKMSTEQLNEWIKQHNLKAEVTADSGEYQVLARWDTPKVVKGVSFMLRLTVAADDGSERLVSTARTTETTYRFRQLALGNYSLTVRAVNAWGQQGDPASVSFRMAWIRFCNRCRCYMKVLMMISIAPAFY